MQILNLILLSTFVLCGIVLGRNPNPCQDVPGSDQFRNDWSSCASYFWCDLGQAVHTVPCPAGLGFNETRQLCTFDAASCEQCPADMDITVANPNDLDCRSHYFCVGGVRTTQTITCALGLRFNRVTGVCDFAEYVACFMESVSVIPEEPEPEPEPEPVPDVGCPPGLTGDYEWNESCHMFIKCFNGVQNGPFSCGTLQFNPFTRSCDHPSNRIPPCSG